MYSNKLGAAEAKTIHLRTDWSLASIVYSGMTPTAYRRLDAAKTTVRAAALRSKGSIDALSRTWRQIGSGALSEEHAKFISYLSEFDDDQLFEIFSRERNFAQLIYTHNTEFCVSRLKSMDTGKQTAILQTPNAVAQMLAKGQWHELKTITEALSDEQRGLIFTDEVKEQANDYARANSQIRGMGLFPVEFTHMERVQMGLVPEAAAA